jgi:ParB family chromosome partitioning protein
MKTIPAIIKDFSDDEMMQIALLENLQRENLTAIEEAKAYKDIIDSMKITQDELAKKVGKSRSHITNMLGLLKLPVSVQDMILYNKLSMGHARVLSKLENQNQIEELADKVIEENLSVRDLEELASSSEFKRVVKTTRKKSTNDEYKPLERYIKEKLGTNVKIGENKMTIKFSSVQDLNRILEIMNLNIDE